MTRQTFPAVILLVVLAAGAVAAEGPTDLTVDKAFRQLPAYTYEKPRRLLRFLEAEIQHATGDPRRAEQMAGRLAEVLGDPAATLDAKRFVCRWLPPVAGEEQVPILARLLKRDETAEMARRALQAIPGDVSGKVLREALPAAGERLRIGLINALGARRDAKAVQAIAAYLSVGDKQTASAAADALGSIGTVEAAEVLAEAAKKASGRRQVDVLRDARLRSARRLARAGKTEPAANIYTSLFAPDLPTRWYTAVLAGWARTAPGAAAPKVAEALQADEQRIRAAAADLVRTCPSPAVAEAAVQRLPDLEPETRVLAIRALAERGYDAAGPAVRKQVDSENRAVREAAVGALARLGDAADVPRLVSVAASGEETVRDAARVALARLNAEGTSAQILRAAQNRGSAERVVALRAIADRHLEHADSVLLAAAGAKNEPAVRVAAFEALAAVGGAAAYDELLGLMAGPSAPAVRDAMVRATATVGRRLPDDAKRVRPVAEALPDSPDSLKVALLTVLSRYGGTEALKAVGPYLDAPDEKVREAAVRALAQWPDTTAADTLLKVARQAGEADHRRLALRGYFRLVRRVADSASRLKMLSQARPVARTAEAKRMLLAGLSEVPDPAALEMAEAYLDDPDVKAEAQAAVQKIRKAQEPRPRGGGAPVPKADPQRLAARRKELDKAAPEGFHLACYMDCGPRTSAGGQGEPTLRVTAGAPYFWAGSDGDADVRYGTIVFTGREVVFEATGLDPERTYRLGFSWWDYDHNTRAQSVWASTGESGRRVRLLGKTQLPSGAHGEKPAENSVPLPRDLVGDGNLQVIFRNEAQPNCVVSEVWLLESDARSPPPADRDKGSRTAPAVRRSPRNAPMRVLLVTGVDHPGHKWQETAPALRQVIEKDPRLAVDVVEDPHWLRTGELNEYKAVIHHWMDWKVPPPGEKARENLARFVREGGGLVLVHFACGAWQDWPGFVKIAGRVWDPKRRAHDPLGPFAVRIVDPAHPVTRGMKGFETVDELYTCLAGRTPVHVLAEATSKVDHKDYPMVFVLTYGEGRVFHSVLGHDTRALEGQVGVLYRRGTAWAAGLDPRPASQDG